MKRFLLTLLLVGSTLLYAQQGMISGVVIDKSTALPAAYVQFYIEVLSIGGVTDNNGHFVMNGLEAGEYSLIFKHIGYNDKVVKVSVGDGERRFIRIVLEKSVAMLKGVEITEGYLRDVPYQTAVINQRQMQERAGRDVGEILKMTPNVSSVKKGGVGSDPVIRGFKYSQLNVQTDNGMKIEGGCPNRMDPTVTHIEMDDVEKVEVIKGPYALRYGTGLGGVINLKTLPAPFIEKSFQTKLQMVQGYESNWNGRKQHYHLKAGNNKAFIDLAGSYKDYGNYKDGDGNSVRSAFKRYNYRAVAGWVPLSNHKLTLMYEESKGRDVLYAALPMDEREDNTRLMSVDYEASHITPWIESLVMKVYRSEVSHLMDNKARPFSDTVVAVSAIDANVMGGRMELGFKKSVLGELALGADFDFYDKSGTRDKNMIMQPGLPVKHENLWKGAWVQNLGVFIQHRYVLGDMKFTTALRLDNNKAGSDAIRIMNPKAQELFYYATDSIESGFLNMSFSAGCSYQMSDKVKVDVAIGRAMRSPDLTERFITLLPVGYDKFDYLGNPALKPETNNQADVTVTYQDETVGDLSVNGFYALVEDYIAGQWIPPTQQKPLSRDVLGVKQYHNMGIARLRGAELLWRSPLKNRLRMRMQAAYTYATLDDSKRYILNDNGDVTGVEGLNNDALAEIPPFEMSAGLAYSLFNDRLVPGITLRFVNEQSHVSAAQYEKSSDGFILANAGVAWVYNKVLTVNAGVNNIFDKAYYEHLNRNIIGSTRPLMEPGRLFFINLIFNI